MVEFSLVSATMTTSCKLSKDDESLSIEPIQYISMIGSLLYLTSSRPDIMQAVRMVAIFQSTTKEPHVVVVNRIFRHLKGTTKFGLWYQKMQNFDLIAYSDVDWARSLDDINGTSGNALFFGEFFVAWSSKKQASISLSTTEVEYIVAVEFCTQVL